MGGELGVDAQTSFPVECGHQFSDSIMGVTVTRVLGVPGVPGCWGKAKDFHRGQPDE